MDEENNKNEKGETPIENLWYRRPGVIIGAIALLIIIGYFFIPLFNKFDSPFTTYKPLDIDSTLLKLDTFPASEQSKGIIPSDSTTFEDTIPENKEDLDIPALPKDSSLKVDLLKVNTSYQHLDPNEQLSNNNDAPLHDDLFSKLILNGFSESEIDELTKQNFIYGIKPVLSILSATAVEILAGERMKYHFDIIDALEDSPSLKGILIVDNDNRVVYATNKKFKDLLVSEVYRGLELNNNNFESQNLEKDKILSMPVYHQYGKIGLILLIY